MHDRLGMPAHIIEVFPVTLRDGQSVTVQRVTTPPNDVGSEALLWTYFLLGIAQATLAITAGVIAAAHLNPQGMCLLDGNTQQRNVCYLTYAVCGLTPATAVGWLLLELLPDRLVPEGLRGTLPLVLLLLGTILWGVESATLRHNLEPPGGLHTQQAIVTRTIAALAWTNFALFLVALALKLLSPMLIACLSRSSIPLSRMCPGGLRLTAAVEACCCLYVRTAEMPREIVRQGQIVVRFVNWNQELVPASSSTAAMAR